METDGSSAGISAATQAGPACFLLSFGSFKLGPNQQLQHNPTKLMRSDDVYFY